MVQFLTIILLCGILVILLRRGEMSREIEKFLKVMCVMFVAIFPLFAAGDFSFYRYQTIRHSGVESWSMKISRQGKATELVITGESTQKKVRFVQNRTEWVEIYKNQKLVRRVEYDYSGNKIRVIHHSGSRQKRKEYKLQGNIFENETLIYLFGTLSLKKGKKYLFQHLNSEELRMAEMYLQNKGEEILKINGKKYRAIHYEMGLNSSLLSTFWPHKYHWWYEVSTGKFLKYEGMAKDGKNIDRSEIVK